MKRTDAFTDCAFEPGVVKPDPVFSAESVLRRFGGITAVDVDRVQFQRGALTSLIGPNGAGKSSFINVVSGFDKAESGTWSVDDRRVETMSASGIARAGMIRTFQHTRPLPELTVLENMRLAAADSRDERLSVAVWSPAWRKRAGEERERATTLLQEFGLGKHLDMLAGSLSGGQRKLLEVARAMIANPQILLLDEPMAGVNPVLREFMGERLQALVARGLTVVMVEHDMPAVMSLSDWIVCMNEGRIIAEGPAHHISGHPEVIDAYLGVSSPKQSGGKTASVAPARESSDVVEPPETAASEGQTVLEVADVVAGYTSGVDILNGCSVIARRGEIVSIIGPNGAGKSTLLKVIFGLLPARQGRLSLVRDDIGGQQTAALVSQGIGYVPQTENVFPGLTVRENLKMGIYSCRGEWRERSEEILQLFPALRPLYGQRAGSLSGGERQLVAMGRALMGQPRLLLLDEPSAGLSPMRMDDLFSWIVTIARTGVTVLLVEQNAKKALEISDRGYVLAGGRNAHEGSGADLLEDPTVIELYLGGLSRAEDSGNERSARL